MPPADLCERSKKPRYSYDEARAKAKTARRRTGDRALREYRCAFCRGWHWGHSLGGNKLGRRPRPNSR